MTGNIYLLLDADGVAEAMAMAAAARRSSQARRINCIRGGTSSFSVCASVAVKIYFMYYISRSFVVELFALLPNLLLRFLDLLNTALIILVACTARLKYIVVYKNIAAA